MKLYDVGETIEEGLPIGVLEEENRTFLHVGRDAEDTEARVILPFGKELSEHLLSESNPMCVKRVKSACMMRGTIAREDGELCLVAFTEADGKALVRVGIAHGIGGKIEYYFDEGVDVIAEGIIGVGEEKFPIYVLVLPQGSAFHIERTGDLCGLPAEMSFTWDGTRIVQKPT